MLLLINSNVDLTGVIKECFSVLGVLGWSIILILLLITLTCWAVIFSDNHKNGYLAFVPFVNGWLMLEMNELLGWFIFIPGVNLVGLYSSHYDYAINNGHEKWFALLTALFPFIFLPVIIYKNDQKERKLLMEKKNESFIVKSVSVDAHRNDVKDTEVPDVELGGTFTENKNYKITQANDVEYNGKLTFVDEIKTVIVRQFRKITQRNGNVEYVKITNTFKTPEDKKAMIMQLLQFVLIVLLELAFFVAVIAIIILS